MKALAAPPDLSAATGDEKYHENRQVAQDQNAERVTVACSRTTFIALAR
jgi:hypothetical protein